LQLCNFLALVTPASAWAFPETQSQLATILAFPCVCPIPRQPPVTHHRCLPCQLIISDSEHTHCLNSTFYITYYISLNLFFWVEHEYSDKNLQLCNFLALVAPACLGLPGNLELASCNTCLPHMCPTSRQPLAMHHCCLPCQLIVSDSEHTCCLNSIFYITYYISLNLFFWVEHEYNNEKCHAIIKFHAMHVQTLISLSGHWHPELACHVTWESQPHTCPIPWQPPTMCHCSLTSSSSSPIASTHIAFTQYFI